jgi:hypothetical protein
MDIIHVVNNETIPRHLLPVLTERAEILYWRTATGEEVDFVIETSAAARPCSRATGLLGRRS